MRKPSSRLFFVIAALGLFGACARDGGAVESRQVRFDGADFRVVDIDLTRETLELHWRDARGNALGSIDALREWGGSQDRVLLFATNAGIYDQQLRPLGLFIESGSTLRPLNTTKAAGRSGNFALQPNGIFYVDQRGHAGVVPTEQWRERAIDARLATQSGPMLVVDGAINANFDAQSDSLKWRSGVCARTPQRVVFAVSATPVTFHAFARLFRDEVGCRDALYLDGTLSRIYARDQGFAGAPTLMLKPYAGMFAVFADSPRTK